MKKKKKFKFTKKRITAIVIAIYVVFKIIVTYTVSPDDDKLPDQVRDILLKLALADNDASVI